MRAGGAVASRAPSPVSQYRAPPRSRASGPSAIGACLRRERGRTCERQHDGERQHTRAGGGARERERARIFARGSCSEAPFSVLELVEQRARRARARERRRERERTGERRHNAQAGGSASEAARERERGRRREGAQLVLGVLVEAPPLFWGLLSPSVAGSLVSRLPGVKGVTCGFFGAEWSGL